MGVYLLIFLTMIILMKFIKKEKFNLADFIIIIMLILIAGLRDGIGTDFNMYKSFYFYTGQQAAAKVEWGFLELIRIVQKIFGERYFLFFTLCSAITIIPIYNIIKKKSNFPIVSLFLFVGLGFYTMSFNMVRQCISIAIMFYATQYIEERSLPKYILFVGLASLFHITAVVMLPMYFIVNRDIDKRTLKLVFIMSLFSGVIFNPIFNYIVNNVPQYHIYKTYDNTVAGIGTYLVNLIYLLIIYFVISNKKSLVKNKFENICLNLSIISVPMIALSLKNTLFARMIYYFFIPISIPFANVAGFFKIEYTQKVFDYVLLIVLFVIYILNIISFNGVYPYISIFN